jgi:hypothetical protein
MRPGPRQRRVRRAGRIELEHPREHPVQSQLARELSRRDRFGRPDLVHDLRQRPVRRIRRGREGRGLGRVDRRAPGLPSAPGIRGIVVDPTTVNRAWYISIQAGWFRSVTFDPVAGTLALGSTVAVSSLQAIAFGPSPNQYIFVSNNFGNKIYAYSAADRSLQATITPSAECTGPIQIILGPDDKHWFGQYNAGNGGFCSINAAGTTFIKLMTAANPRCLTAGKSVTGAGNAIWVADFAGRSATELIEAATAHYSVAVPSGTDLRPIAASPAVTSPVEYPAFIWVVTNGGLERLQPQ